jgi:hypothetical protein
MVASIVQDNTGFAGGGVTTFTVTLSAVTAGNLIVWCAGGDKNIGTLTLTGFTLPVNLRSTDNSVSLVIGYKVAVGGETAISGTISGANTGGSNLWACDLSEAGAGAWEEKATAATNNSTGTNVPDVSSGTTGTICGGGGLAIAAFSVDSVSTNVGTAAYTNSFVAEQNAVNGNAEAGLWVATKAVSAGGTAETTLSRTGGTITNDQMNGGMIVVGRAVGGSTGRTVGFPRQLRTALVR